MRSEMEEPINEKLQETAKYEKLEKLTRASKQWEVTQNREASTNINFNTSIQCQVGIKDFNT